MRNISNFYKKVIIIGTFILLILLIWRFNYSITYPYYQNLSDIEYSKLTDKLEEISGKKFAFYNRQYSYESDGKFYLQIISYEPKGFQKGILINALLFTVEID